MAQALNLPEIKILVGEHLDRKSIYACVQVSHSFRAVFSPFLYKFLILGSSDASSTQARVAPKTLSANAYHVEELSLAGQWAVEYYEIQYPRLRVLRLDKLKYGPQVLLDQISKAFALGNLARLNPTVEFLSIVRLGLHLPDSFWDAISQEWHKPWTLLIQDISVSEYNADAFLKACARFENIELYEISLEPVAAPLTHCFRRIKTLSIAFHPQPHLMSALDQLAFIKCCPELTSLTWDLRGLILPLQELKEAFKEKTWPKLDSLRLLKTSIESDELQGVLDIAPPLKVLELWSCSFTRVALNSLENRHFKTLVKLQLGNLVGLSDNMALAVLSGCPLLEDFVGGQILAQNIAKWSRPWVCERLKSLRIYIMVYSRDPPEWEHAALVRLAALKNLQFLNLQRNIAQDQHEMHDGRFVIARPIRRALAKEYASLAKLGPHAFHV
ncbi:hypothetical protein BG011_000012 [Mortierella polycephala]|uniref:F-box domain-containing protein n=1 Tax=Mortierella polycephala TaxID=41804 RepID=A0A9P6UBL1_9FUNG|nr:hypothetical protein BG011_000012 [Mortierella polycephala]